MLMAYYCIKAWSNKFRKIIRATPEKTAKELRNEAVKELRDILYNPYINKAEEDIVKFKAKWANHNEGKILEYLEKRYFTVERKMRWMKAYRTGKYYAGMDTNNYVESWHNHLKSHFLRGHSNCRGDRLIYILANDVDEFYQMMAMQNLVRRGRHTRGEINDFKQLEFLEGKTIEELRSFVIDIGGAQNMYCVRSFSVSGGYYFISVLDNVIKGCNCQYFVYSHRPCRHMLVLHRVFQNNGKPPLSIIHHIVNKSHSKHAVIELESSISEINIGYSTEVIEDSPEETADDEINESIELVRKFIHNSEDLIRSPEVAKRIRMLADGLSSLPTRTNTSGVQKRQRQKY